MYLYLLPLYLFVLICACNCFISVALLWFTPTSIIFWGEYCVALHCYCMLLNVSHVPVGLFTNAGAQGTRWTRRTMTTHGTGESQRETSRWCKCGKPDLQHVLSLHQRWVRGGGGAWIWAPEGWRRGGRFPPVWPRGDGPARGDLWHAQLPELPRARPAVQHA